MNGLIDPSYMSFPFRITNDGVATSKRREHIRHLIEQVLFTNPNERMFRLEFGAGVMRMVFEGNTATLWALAKQRLTASLAEVLRSEVDPQSLTIDVKGKGNEGSLYITISYRLATINRREEHLFTIDGGTFG